VVRLSVYDGRRRPPFGLQLDGPPVGAGTDGTTHLSVLAAGDAVALGVFRRRESLAAAACSHDFHEPDGDSLQPR
jgi:hypothetical protein